MVWQTRCVKKCAPEKLILVPWADDLSRAARAAASPDNSAAAADAAKDKTAGAEKDRKRPKALHPYLPWRVMCVVDYGSVNGNQDKDVFQVQSPLASKQYGGLSPAPFWCVLASKDAEKVNMEKRQCILTLPKPTVSVDDIRLAKKKKAQVATITFPVFVNKKPLHDGDVLVADADGIREAGAVATPQGDQAKGAA